MAVAITTSRQFRKGRVLVGTVNDVLLVNSPSPRIWNGVVVSHDPTRDPEYRSFTSSYLRGAYKAWQTSLTQPRSNTQSIEVVDEIMRRWGHTADFAVRSALTRGFGKKKPAGTASVLSASSLAASTILPSPAELVAKYGPSMEPAPHDPLAAKTSTKASGKRKDNEFKAPEMPTEPYWYESEQDRNAIEDFISLHDAGYTVNLMIAGPSGAGKTKGVENLAKKMGIPLHIVNCQAITTPEKWVGQVMADPVKGTYFVPSQHIQWVEGTHEDCEGSERCILLYDEITRLRPELNNMTYSLFDTQRGLEVPQMGRRVFMSPKNIVISTANIGAAFAGTFGQDRAFRERFAMTIERDFPPFDEEVKIMRSFTNDRLTEDNAKALARIAEASRRLWREGTIEQPISTRTLNVWALLVAGGRDVMAAAERTVLPLYSEDGGVDSDRAKVRLQIEGKVA